MSTLKPMNTGPVDFSRATQADIDMFYSPQAQNLPDPAGILESHCNMLQASLPPYLQKHFAACMPIRQHNTLAILHESLTLLEQASNAPIDAANYCYTLATAMQVGRGAALGAVMQSLEEAGEQAKLSAVIERCELVESVQQSWSMHDLLMTARSQPALVVAMQAATCCAMSLVCGVVSPEMWPVPPEIWKRHKLSLKSYDSWRPEAAWGGA